MPKGGRRPGIDPTVHFKMLMIGVFEDLPSEHAIATSVPTHSRCAPSLDTASMNELSTIPDWA
jgi:hypothetical protein